MRKVFAVDLLTGFVVFIEAVSGHHGGKRWAIYLWEVMRRTDIVIASARVGGKGYAFNPVIEEGAL